MTRGYRGPGGGRHVSINRTPAEHAPPPSSDTSEALDRLHATVVRLAEVLARLRSGA